MALAAQRCLPAPVAPPHAAASSCLAHAAWPSQEGASHGPVQGGRPCPSACPCSCQESTHSAVVPRQLSGRGLRGSLPPHACPAGSSGQFVAPRPGMVRVDVAARLALLGLLAAPSASHGGMAVADHHGNPQGTVALASPGVYRCEGREGTIYQQHPCRHLEGAPLALPPAASPVADPPAVAQGRDSKDQAGRGRSAARQAAPQTARQSVRQAARGLTPTPAQVRAADERLRAQQGGDEGAAKSSRRGGRQQP